MIILAATPYFVHGRQQTGTATKETETESKRDCKGEFTDDRLGCFKGCKPGCDALKCTRCVNTVREKRVPSTEGRAEPGAGGPLLV